MKQREQQLLHKLANGASDVLPGDASDEFRLTRRIMDTAAQWQPPSSQTKDQLWSALEVRMDQAGAHEAEPAIRKRMLYLRVGIAAMLVIAVALVYHFAGQQKVSTGAGEMHTFYLPDSSRVVLNAHSHLSYSEDGYLDNRKIKLRGEAFFDVKRGGGFTVKSNGVQTRVLATSFNVYARGKWVEVECLSGSVEVTARNSSILLEPGQAIQCESRRMNKPSTAIDPAKSQAWMKGKFYYKKAALDRVIRELEIQFDIDIGGQEFKGRVYTGYFDSSSMDKALKQVLIPMGYSYSVSGQSVSVK